MHYKDMNAKLEVRLHCYKSVLSTLQETPVDNLSACIAEDLAAGHDEDASLDDDVSEEGANMELKSCINLESTF